VRIVRNSSYVNHDRILSCFDVFEIDDSGLIHTVFVVDLPLC